VLVALGDTRAMGGDLEGALREYTRAMQLNPRDAEAVQRATMLGKAAPELESKEWLGAEAKKLADLQGQVVILHFWASWSSSCLQAMPALDALYQANAHAGLTVLGVTRWYDHGYLPLDAQDLRDGSMAGTIVDKLEESAFAQHLRDFRDRTKLSYPFVISTLDEVKSFGVTDLPTTLIVDKQGKVAFIAVGGMREHLLRITVERLLTAK
jgi:thiol-disulfide isomerase/thioredoxin